MYCLGKKKEGRIDLLYFCLGIGTLSSAASFHRAHHAFGFAGAVVHGFHHLADVVELLDEAVDVLDVTAGAAGDAFAARAVDDVGVGSLLGGHRLDHHLHALEHVVVDVHVADQLAHAGAGSAG